MAVSNWHNMSNSSAQSNHAKMCQDVEHLVSWVYFIKQIAFQCIIIYPYYEIQGGLQSFWEPVEVEISLGSIFMRYWIAFLADAHFTMIA